MFKTYKIDNECTENIQNKILKQNFDTKKMEVSVITFITNYSNHSGERTEKKSIMTLQN